MKIKNSAADIIMEVLGLIMLIGTPLYLFISWPSIPDKLPMHYNFAGRDRSLGRKRRDSFYCSDVMDTVPHDFSGRVFPFCLEYRSTGDARE